MYTLLRLIALVLPTLLFWAAWYVLPALVEPASLRWFSGIVTVLWALEFYFYQRLSGLSTLPGLSSRERDRLHLRLSEIRSRVARGCDGAGLLCSTVGTGSYEPTGHLVALRGACRFFGGR